MIQLSPRQITLLGDLKMVIHNFQDIEHGFCGNVVFNRFDVLDCTEGENLDVMVMENYRTFGFNKSVVAFKALAEHATTRFTEIKALAALEKLREIHMYWLSLNHQTIDRQHLTNVFGMTDLTL